MNKKHKVTFTTQEIVDALHAHYKLDIPAGHQVYLGSNITVNVLECTGVLKNVYLRWEVE